MKKILAIILSLSFLVFLFGCGTQNSAFCTHSWERIENFNEYTAMDKCSICNATRKYTDPDEIPHSGTESGFIIYLYDWSGYGISQKEIHACDLGYAILDCISKLQETNDVAPKISDAEFDCYSPWLLDTEGIARGTVWLDCGSIGLFRLNPEMTDICTVQSHFGEGKVLKMTDTLKELLHQAWYYHPNDYWSGLYENGEVTLRQVFKADSAVDSVRIDRISIENNVKPNNSLGLSIRAIENKNASVRLMCQQSDDNLAAGDFQDIVLRKGEETEVELNFGGFKNVPYFVTIIVDNTRIHLTINPKNIKDA